MKPIRPLFAAALLALAAPAWSINLPPMEDTFSTLTLSRTGTVTNTTVKSSNGAKTTLPVSKTSHALIQFNAAGSGVPAAAVTRAVLTIYLPIVTKAGDLNVSLVTSDWHETFAGVPVVEPTSGASFATIPAATVVKKQFIMVDVTSQVKGWIGTPANDFGVVISSPDGVAKVAISSKEGSGTGYPATLEIETNGALADGSFSFSGNVGIGTNTPAFPLDIEGTGDLVLNLNQTSSGGTGIIQTNPDRSYFTGIFGGNNRWSIYDATGGNFQERLTVASNGRVGIGTSTPGYPLEIAGGGDTQLAITSTSTNGRTYTLQSSNGGAVLGDGAFQIVDRTAAAARLVIDKTGNVGIGAYPGAAKLDVRGDVKLGPSGQFFAVSGPENLRTLRGIISVGSGPSVLKGTGFTVARTPGFPTGTFTVTFSSAFADFPAVTITPFSDLGGAARIATIFDLDSTAVVVKTFNEAGGLVDASFSFIGIGPR